MPNQEITRDDLELASSHLIAFTRMDTKSDNPLASLTRVEGFYQAIGVTGETDLAEKIAELKTAQKQLPQKLAYGSNGEQFSSVDWGKVAENPNAFEKNIYFKGVQATAIARQNLPADTKLELSSADANLARTEDPVFASEERVIGGQKDVIASDKELIGAQKDVIASKERVIGAQKAVIASDNKLIDGVQNSLALSNKIMHQQAKTINEVDDILNGKEGKTAPVTARSSQEERETLRKGAMQTVSHKTAGEHKIAGTAKLVEPTAGTGHDAAANHMGAQVQFAAAAKVTPHAAPAGP